MRKYLKNQLSGPDHVGNGPRMIIEDFRLILTQLLFVIGDDRGQMAQQNLSFRRKTKRLNKLKLFKCQMKIFDKHNLTRYKIHNDQFRTQINSKTIQFEYKIEMIIGKVSCCFWLFIWST